LAWRARAKGCRPETTRLVINERHPEGRGRVAGTRDLWLSAATGRMWTSGSASPR
jgi:hypothetical protein